MKACDYCGARDPGHFRVVVEEPSRRQTFFPSVGDIDLCGKCYVLLGERLNRAMANMRKAKVTVPA